MLLSLEKILGPAEVVLNPLLGCEQEELNRSKRDLSTHCAVSSLIIKMGCPQFEGM